jgi:3-hydroxyisobutyrate dehydrogenase
MAEHTRVGFIGLGAMGSGLAGRVLEAGYPLGVYNRTAERAAPLVARGAWQAGTPAELAAASEVVITMLADPAAVRDILARPDGVLAGARTDLTLIEMTTVGPLDARATVELARERGVRVLHASVLGPPSAAAAGTVTILAGGDSALIEVQRPLLRTMASTIMSFPSNEQGCALKVASNALLLTSLQAVGEAVGLAEGWGIPKDQLLHFFGDSAVVPQATKGRLAQMYDPHAAVHFALSLGRKDLSLAAAAAYEVGMATPVISAALQTFSLALRDHGSEDIARIAGFLDEQRMAR